MDLQKLKISQRNRKFESTQIKNFFSDINLKDFSNKKILDIGCGNGYILIGLKQKLNIHAFGIDILDIENLENKSRINFVNKNVFNTSLHDFKTNGFDLIYSFRMFLHLNSEEKLKLFRKLYYEFLNQGGVMLIDFSGDTSKNNTTQISREDLILISKLRVEFENLDIITKEYNFDKDLAISEKDLSIKDKIEIITGIHHDKKFKAITLKIIKK